MSKLTGYMENLDENTKEREQLKAPPGFYFGQVVGGLYSCYLLWWTEVKQIGVQKWE